MKKCVMYVTRKVMLNRVNLIDFWLYQEMHNYIIYQNASNIYNKCICFTESKLENIHVALMIKGLYIKGKSTMILYREFGFPTQNLDTFKHLEIIQHGMDCHKIVIDLPYPCV